MTPTTLSSQLYITEATESKAKAEAELNIADPDKEEGLALLESNKVETNATTKRS